MQNNKSPMNNFHTQTIEIIKSCNNKIKSKKCATQINYK